MMARNQNLQESSSGDHEYPDFQANWPAHVKYLSIGVTYPCICEQHWYQWRGIQTLNQHRMTNAFYHLPVLSE